MKNPSLDAEIIRFIECYLKTSGLSTSTSVKQQRIDYEAMVRQFSYPHPPGIRTRFTWTTSKMHLRPVSTRTPSSWVHPPVANNRELAHL
jgi:hypothetical protein